MASLERKSQNRSRREACCNFWVIPASLVHKMRYSLGEDYALRYTPLYIVQVQAKNRS